jgi:hypothetical protein
VINGATCESMSMFLSFAGFDDRDIQKNVAKHGSEQKDFFNLPNSFRQRFPHFLIFLSLTKNKKPSVFTTTYEEGIKRVLEGNYAFLMESTMLDYQVQRDCNLTQIGGNSSPPCCLSCTSCSPFSLSLPFSLFANIRSPRHKRFGCHL